MPTNPLYTRRYLELHRNEEVFTNKAEAMRALYDKDFRLGLKDGEPVIARYMVWYDLNTQTDMYTQANTPTVSTANYYICNIVSVENGDRTTRIYSSTDSTDREQSDIIMKSNNDGTYDAFMCVVGSNVPVGTLITHYEDPILGPFSNIQTEFPGTYQHIATVSTLFGLVSITGDNLEDIKITFFEDEEEIKTLLSDLKTTVELATYAVKESGGSGLTGVDNFLMKDSTGKLTTLYVWDCGDYS